MSDIRYDRGGNYADFVIDATSGHDVKEWMWVDLDPRALGRARELDASAGTTRAFLSFQERVDWARSEATMEDALAIIEQRMAIYAANGCTSDVQPTW